MTLRVAIPGQVGDLWFAPAETVDWLGRVLSIELLAEDDSLRAKTVALKVYDYQLGVLDNGAIDWPTVDELAADLHCSAMEIRRHLDACLAAGLLQVLDVDDASGHARVVLGTDA